MDDLRATEPGENRSGANHQPRSRNPHGAETVDKLAGKKSRSVHGDHMPLDPQIRCLLGNTVHVHRQGRGCHQEVHHHIGDSGAEYRSQKAGLTHDLAQRTPGGGRCRRCGLCRDHPLQDEGRHYCHQRLAEKGNGKGIGRPEVHGAGHQHRADDASQHAAAHHQRQRPGSPLRRDAVRGGKAEAERNRGIGSAKKRGETKQQK